MIYYRPVAAYQLHDICPECGCYVAEHIRHIDDIEPGPCPRAPVPNRLHGAAINAEGEAI